VRDNTSALSIQAHHRNALVSSFQELGEGYCSVKAICASVRDPPEKIRKDASIEGFSQGLSMYLESPMPCRTIFLA
jgi:hypothetical protein